MKSWRIKWVRLIKKFNAIIQKDLIQGIQGPLQPGTHFSYLSKKSPIMTLLVSSVTTESLLKFKLPVNKSSATSNNSKE
jgi:hypothetical protein